MENRKRLIPDFFSRIKKPTLLPLLIIIAVAAGAIGIFVTNGAKEYAAVISILVAAFAFGMAGVLVVMFLQQLSYNPYSYNAIFYAGFSLFLLSIMISHIILAVHMLEEPDVYEAYMVLSTLTDSAQTFVMISFPFLLIFSVLLCISNISLIRHEGKRFANFLGIILSILIMGGWLFLYVFDFSSSGSQMQVMIHALVTNLMVAIYLYFECMLIGVIIVNVVVVRYEPKKDMDYIIILGCGIRKDGTPTPILKSRLDRALLFYRQQKEQTGKELCFITSGGKGSDEVISESECMKRYLTEHGISDEQIIEENQSTTTLENMRFSKEKLADKSSDAKIAFSTNNYHVFRSGYFAGCVGMRAVGMGAKTKWYFWPNAAVREFIGLLTKQKVLQLLIIGGMVAFYIVTTLMTYMQF